MKKCMAIAIYIATPFSPIAYAGPAEEANAVIDQWSATYTANDPNALVALYAPDAILLGTTSPVISEGAEGIRKYFQELPGSGRKNKIVDRRTIVLSETAVVGTGFYDFCTHGGERHAPAITFHDGRCKARWTMDDLSSSFFTLSATRQ
jgi:uncharacterized protein (TIGR02246 family)